MHQDPDKAIENREYSNTSRESYYAHPDYYSTETSQSSSALPKSRPMESYIKNTIEPEYARASMKDAYDYSKMTAYNGPSSIEGYTIDAGASQREAAQQGMVEGAKIKRKRGLAGIASALAAAGAWLLKLKGLVFFFKFGLTAITALFSIAVYSLIFGWSFAIGLVLLLFIHEMGHAVVMKAKGIPVGGMVFVPMLGAAVTMRRMPQNARDEAEVGIAGPIAGTVASSVCLYLAYQPGASLLWASLAYFGFFINLFNLIPIVPFDGGRVLAAIDRRVWILGFLALLGLQIWEWLQGTFSIWLLLFVVLAATQLWSRGFGRGSRSPEVQTYYQVPIGTRIVLSLLYFGLAAVLVLGMTIAHSRLPVAQ